MQRRIRTWLAGLCLAVLSLGSLPSASADDMASGDTLVLPGDDFYPESIHSAADGTLFVGSLITGEIVRFRPGSTTAETFVPAGVNVGTGGVLVDAKRGVLWACAVDPSYRTPFMLRAFGLRDGALKASYTVPDQGICADLTLAHGALYIADASNPTLTPYRGARMLRLTTPDPLRPAGGTLAVWSRDAKFTGDRAALQIDGIAFDGHATIYTTNNDTGELLRVGIGPGGSALPAVEVALRDGPLVLPDGIRMLSSTQLLVTELGTNRLLRIDVTRGTTTVVATGLGEPTAVAAGPARGTWVSEGQVLRLQQNTPPVLPFKIRRVRAGWEQTP